MFKNGYLAITLARKLRFAGFLIALDDRRSHPRISPNIPLSGMNVLDWLHLDSIEPHQNNLLAMANPATSSNTGKKGKPGMTRYEGQMRNYLLESHGVKDHVPVG